MKGNAVDSFVKYNFILYISDFYESSLADDRLNYTDLSESVNDYPAIENSTVTL